MQKEVNMEYSQLTCRQFVEELASGSAAPGGEDAAALIGAIGTALGNMAMNMPKSDKKYSEALSDLASLKNIANEMQENFLGRVGAGGREQNPNDRCDTMLTLMKACCSAVDLLKSIAAKGPAIALPNVGYGVICCRAALQMASLVVFSSAAELALSDRKTAAGYTNRANDLLSYTARVDEIYVGVLGRYV